MGTKECPTWARVLYPDLFDALSKPLCKVGQEVDLVDQIDGEEGMIPVYGSGTFTVIGVKVVPEESIVGVGHRQWVELSKIIELNGKLTVVVFDSYQHQWVLQGNLSHFGKEHPSILSGAWIKPLQQDKK